MSRYLIGSKGQYSWGDESTSYQEAATPNWFGLTTEDVTFPNPNPHDPLATGGTRRGPHSLSPAEKEYPFDVVFEVLDEFAPFHIALGNVATATFDPDSTPSSGDEYTRYLFTEADVLPTMSVTHAQTDASLETTYIGTKASLNLAASVGERVKATMNCMAVSYDVDDAASVFDDLSATPQFTPYRFSHMDGQNVEFTLSETGDEGTAGDNVKSLATIDSYDLGWDNGLEAVHHGSNGRDPYSIVEGESENKYNMTLGVTVTDLDLYKRASEDKELVDVTITHARETGTGGVVIDGFIIRLLECKVTDAPSPFTAKGRVTGDVTLQPRDTELEIRRPL